MSVDIELFSDLVCPWCYLGKHRLERALAQLPDGPPVRIIWRSLELFPARSRHRPPLPPRSQELDRDFLDQAHTDALPLARHPPPLVDAYDAHRLVQVAREQGLDPLRVADALFHAGFVEGGDLSNHQVLEMAGAEAGMPRELIRETLAGDGGTAGLTADLAHARELNVRAVPFYLMDGRIEIIGAETTDVLLEALSTVVAECDHP
ncbi:DsbA family oxidoreductase [Alkalilimnicola ehrlichii MLHE-1]|nr:DsbA family oxidoreductase [Alkalilimnicola ehrlichii]